MLCFESLDDAFFHLVGKVASEGVHTAPRGLATRELLCTSFELMNPRRRCVTQPERRWSFPAALGELWWHLAGSDDLNFLSFYLPRWKDFSDDSQRVRGSCYGRRIFAGGERSQWKQLVALLKADPASRRAVLFFDSDETSRRPDILDAPCTVSLQFLLRGGRLHAIATMRSNDVFLGLPYDVFFFTMLHELVALELQAQLGSYYHQAASLHLYARDDERARRVVGMPPKPQSFEMPRMSAPDVPVLLELEQRLRAGLPVSNAALNMAAPYWRELIEVTSVFASRRRGASNSQSAGMSLKNRYATLVALASSEGTHPQSS
jgi:thymidylate synthase